MCETWKFALKIWTSPQYYGLRSNPDNDRGSGSRGALCALLEGNGAQGWGRLWRGAGWLEELITVWNAPKEITLCGCKIILTDRGKWTGFTSGPYKGYSHSGFPCSWQIRQLIQSQRRLIMSISGPAGRCLLAYTKRSGVVIFPAVICCVENSEENWESQCCWVLLSAV